MGYYHQHYTVDLSQNMGCIMYILQNLAYGVSGVTGCHVRSPVDQALLTAREGVGKEAVLVKTLRQKRVTMEHVKVYIKRSAC